MTRALILAACIAGSALSAAAVTRGIANAAHDAHRHAAYMQESQP